MDHSFDLATTMAAILYTFHNNQKKRKLPIESKNISFVSVFIEIFDIKRHRKTNKYHGNNITNAQLVFDTGQKNDRFERNFNFCGLLKATFGH